MPIRPLEPRDIGGSILPESLAMPHLNEDRSMMGAAMRQDNLLVSTYVKNQHKPGPLTEEESQAFLDGTFDYKQFMPPEHAEYEQEYARYATSPRHAMWVKSNIDQQLRDRQTLEQGGIPGFLASTFAAMTSPEQYPFYFIGGNVLLNPRILSGSRAATVIGTEATIGAASATASEALLHGTQATRTTEESAFAIGASALFGGLIAGGYHGIKGINKEIQPFLRSLDNDQRILEMEGRMADMEARSIGAAESDAPIAQRHAALIQERKAMIEDPNTDPARKVEAQRELDELIAMPPERLTELQSPRIAKWLGFANPVIRMSLSKSSLARELADSLIDSTMGKIRHQYGDALTPSVESHMTQFQAEQGFRAEEILNTVYKELQKQADQQKISFDDFTKKIGKALRNKDIDPEGNTFITKAAQMMRKEIFEPVQARLDAQDLLPREVNNWETLRAADLENYMEPEEVAKLFKEDGLPKASIKHIPEDVRKILMREGKLTSDIKIPKGDASYLHRMWNFEAIEQNKVAFRNRVSDYIYDQAVDAEYQRMVGAYEEMLDPLDKKIAGVEKRVEAEAKKNKKRSEAKQETPEEAATRRAETARRQAQERQLVEEGKLEKVSPDRRTLQQTLNDLRFERDTLTAKIENAKAALEAKKPTLRAQADNGAIRIEEAILRTAYEPSLNANRMSVEAGALKLRTIDIPSNVVEDFLENDVTKVLESYVRSINAELHLKERFLPSNQNAGRTGDATAAELADEIKRKLDEVQAEYRTLENAELSRGTAKGNKAASKIAKEWEDYKRDFNAMIDSLYGRYKAPENPSGFWSQAGKRLREFNAMTMLGMVAISSIPDLGSMIARRGFRGFGSGVGKLVDGSEFGKMNRSTLKRLGLSFDLINSSRFEKMFMNGDEVAPNTSGTAGRLWRNLNVGFSKATGMPYWNNAMKAIVAGNFSEDVMKDAVLAAAGKLDAAKRNAYAKAGLSHDMMKRIGKELDDAQIVDGHYVLDPDSWKDQHVADVFKAAIRKEVDTTIVTPGHGDLPLFSRGEVGKLVTQFKSFAFAANHKILMAGLDDFNYRRVEGLLTAVTLGYMSYVVKETLKGNEVQFDYDTFVREGLDRSGQLAFWGDLNGILSKATTGEVDAYRLLGADKAVMTRYASRNMLGALMGISAGRIQDIGQLTTAIANGDFTESDIRAVRRAIIYNNLWATHYGFTKLEKALQ